MPRVRREPEILQLRLQILLTFTNPSMGLFEGTEILDESDTSGNITEEYVLFGGKRVAMRDVSSGNIYYYAADMLGSARTQRGLPGRCKMGPPESPVRGARGIVEPGGSVQAGQVSLCGVHPERSRRNADFYPFGGELAFTDTCAQNYKFTGKERDPETGNDNFGARYYSSSYGRFLSPDWSAIPAAVPYANLTNPQTLNLYQYVEDDPETFADLDGHGDQSSNQSAQVSITTCVSSTAPSHVDSVSQGGSCTTTPTTTGQGEQELQQKAQTKAQNLSVETDKNGVTTVTLRSTDASVTTNKDGSITMTTTTTTQTYKFNSAGNLISGQSQTVGTAFTMKGDQYTTQAINSSRTLTQAEATRTLGGTDFSHLDTRGTLARYPGTVAADYRANPEKYRGAAGEIGLLFVPVADEVEGYKLSLELHVAAVELVRALEDR